MITRLCDMRLEEAICRRAHYPEGITVDTLREFWAFSKDIDRMRQTFGEWYAEDLANVGEAGHFRPVTVMPVEAYLKFVSTPEEYYKTYWEIGKTWHNKYSSDCSYGRLFNEERLFGGKCETNLCHAIAFHDKMGEGKATEVALYLQRFCPAEAADTRMTAVVWKPYVMDDATYTLGDSQQNIIAMPWECLQLAFALHYAYTGLMVGKYTLEWGFSSREFSRFASMALLFGCRRNPYIELQLHRQLTYADIDFNTTLKTLGDMYDA